MASEEPGVHQKTLGSVKGDDTRDVVFDIRLPRITPHGAQNIQSRRRSAIDGRNVGHRAQGTKAENSSPVG